VLERIMNNEFRPQRIRDPVHNLIEFQADEFENAMWRVVETRSFQRLRRVKQLGFSDLVFPGATHSRLAHSVGVFHTARQLMKVIENHMGQRSFEPTPAHVALAASLFMISGMARSATHSKRWADGSACRQQITNT
jgi:HD superfamily phosphohydrolase